MSDKSKSETLKEQLGRVMGGGNLSAPEAEGLFGALMDGALGEAHQAAFLVALAMKGETVDELTGAARAMRRRVVTIPLATPRIIDTCGTGGDGKGTFNISTAAALVAAAGGAPVAKHGNRSISSRSGSADVLEVLGVRLDRSPEESARILEEVGIAFLFAPNHHPAMREVMPVRRALAVRTIFNLLGPLTNPAGAKRQVLGVFAAERVAPMAQVLANLGSEHALVVHGHDGLDEFSTTGLNRVAEVREGEVRTFEIGPEDVGLPTASIKQLAGGGPKENARQMERVLGGEPGPLANITAFNAGAALWVAGVAESFPDGVRRAGEILRTGQARRTLEALVSWVP